MESNIWEMVWDNINYIVYGLFIFGIGDLNIELVINLVPFVLRASLRPTYTRQAIHNKEHSSCENDSNKKVYSE